MSELGCGQRPSQFTGKLQSILATFYGHTTLYFLPSYYLPETNNPVFISTVMSFQNVWKWNPTGGTFWNWLFRLNIWVAAFPCRAGLCNTAVARLVRWFILCRTSGLCQFRAFIHKAIHPWTGFCVNLSLKFSEINAQKGYRSCMVISYFII